MRLDENGANTPELSDAPPEVATLGRDVAGTEVPPKGRPRRPDAAGIPTLLTFPPPGSHSPGPRGAEKLTLVAPTRAHRRAAAPPTWPAPGTAPRGAPPTPPGGSAGRP
ncbi:uncharacterized protein LOC143269030 [Peromyscus maniculatus bairdii]|uniref:uncharacterized protein LOC143269030 n=1 Tax=Peromyscus maniculatus bairdii TaxID=230844 RepID=UPI003FD09E33